MISIGSLPVFCMPWPVPEGVKVTSPAETGTIVPLSLNSPLPL